MLILCEKCNNYAFFECDEDGNWDDGCTNLNVKTGFDNWRRLYKCKYYRKITKKKFQKVTRRNLSYLLSLLFRYKDGEYLRKAPKGAIYRIKAINEMYLGYRDYLLRISQTYRFIEESLKEGSNP